MLRPSGDEITTVGAEAYKHFDGNRNNQLGMTEFVSGAGALVANRVTRFLTCEVFSDRCGQLGLSSYLVLLLHARY